MKVGNDNPLYLNNEVNKKQFKLEAAQAFKDEKLSKEEFKDLAKSINGGETRLMAAIREAEPAADIEAAFKSEGAVSVSNEIRNLLFGVKVPDAPAEGRAVSIARPRALAGSFNSSAIQKNEPANQAPIPAVSPSQPPDWENEIYDIGRVGNARILVDARETTPGDRGTGEGLGTYLCDYTFKITSDAARNNPDLKVTGFIHTPDDANNEELADVLGVGVKGTVEQLSSTNPGNPVTILVTGFTRFSGVPDNPTGEFLFGDGHSDGPGSFGETEPGNQVGNGLLDASTNTGFREGLDRLDAMMREQYGDNIQMLDYTVNDRVVGRTYNLTDGTVVNLVAARLPVDTDLTNTEWEDGKFPNPPGDGTGTVLNRAMEIVNPDAVISFGVGADRSHEYEIETRPRGFDYGGQRSSNYDDNTAPNYDLANIYARQLNYRQE